MKQPRLVRRSSGPVCLWHKLRRQNKQLCDFIALLRNFNGTTRNHKAIIRNQDAILCNVLCPGVVDFGALSHHSGALPRRARGAQ